MYDHYWDGKGDLDGKGVTSQQQVLAINLWDICENVHDGI